MPEVRVSLDISYQDYLAYYEGVAESVVTKTRDGRKVKFPARVLRPFLSQQGIIGEFLIRFNDRRKFVGIEKLNKK